MYAIINGRIFNGIKIIYNHSIIIEDKYIKKIVKSEDLDVIYPNIEKINADGNLIAPAFIDLQLNGCGGVLINDEVSIKTFEIMNETNIKSGCTMYAPTLITCKNEKIINALNVIDKIDNLENLGVIGLHIEGPNISVEKRGTHQADLVRKLSPKMINIISESKTSIITVAPETIDGKSIEILAKSGIKVAMGHTNATYEESIKKIPYGITMATHLYNGMSAFSHRNPGVIGAIFDSKNINVGIIVDGVHSHYAAIRVAKKILGERLYLVTDAASPAGTDMTEFMLEGKKCFRTGNELRNEDGSLAGSILTMIKGVQNLVEHVGLSLEEALRMASLYPARIIGIDDKYGKIHRGYMADLVILNEKIEIENVIVKGKEYKRFFSK